MAAAAIFRKHWVWKERCRANHNLTSHSHRPQRFQNVFAYITAFGKKTIYNQHISCFQCKSIFLSYLVNSFTWAKHRIICKKDCLGNHLANPLLISKFWPRLRFHLTQSNLMKILSFHVFSMRKFCPGQTALEKKSSFLLFSKVTLFNIAPSLRGMLASKILGTISNGLVIF